MNCLQVCLPREAEVHSFNARHGLEQRGVVTNHLAWRGCITSKSHTLISSLLYKKLECKFHSLHLKHLTPKLCLCSTKRHRENISMNSVKGALIKHWWTRWHVRSSAQMKWARWMTSSSQGGFTDSGPNREKNHLRYDSATDWLTDFVAAVTSQSSWKQNDCSDSRYAVHYLYV